MTCMSNAAPCAGAANLGVSEETNLPTTKTASDLTLFLIFFSSSLHFHSASLKCADMAGRMGAGARAIPVVVHPRFRRF